MLCGYSIVFLLEAFILKSDVDAEENIITNSLAMEFKLISPAADGGDVSGDKQYLQIEEVSAKNFTQYLLDSLSHLSKLDRKEEDSFRLRLLELSKVNDSYPVTQITFHEAVGFSEWLSIRENRDYKLPTQEQWLLGCDGNLQSASIVLKSRLVPCSEALQNSLGFKGIYGNVRELCDDWPYSADRNELRPSVVFNSRLVLTKGGSFESISDDKYYTCAHVDWIGDDLRQPDVGFRLLLNIPAINP